jgi:4-hydroxy-tetrahydrodipicolinate synthase
MEVQWKGVYPAITAKFKDDESLDIRSFIKNIRAQIDAGVDGIIIGGSLGESSTITHAERIELLQACQGAFGGQIPFLINIAEGATREAIDLARKAQDAGADGLMVLPPMMYKSTDDETVHYFQTIARSTDLPILLYNNPVDYKIEITLPMMEVLLQEPNIQAVKESTRDVSNVTRLRNAFGADIKILCGVDTLAMESIVMGADGWVAGLVAAFPAETVAIYRLTLAGRIEQAREIHRWFLPILELDINPQLVQNIKLAEVMTGLGTEYVRQPRRPLEGLERKRVLAILQEGLANRPQLPDYLKITL